MKDTAKGRWITRFSIYSFSILLGFLFYYLLGFILSDIADYGRPSYYEIEKQHVSRALKDNELQLRREQIQKSDQIKAYSENQQYIKSNADNLKTTINQMLELEKARLQKNLPISEKDKTTLNQSQTLFLEYQAKYQALNADLLRVQQEKQLTSQRLKEVQDKLREQRVAAHNVYDEQYKSYNLKQATLQVSSLLIIFLLSLILLRQYYDNKYQILFKAFTIAVVVKTGFTIHEYFPTRYFKYILILTLIVFVIYLVVRLINSILSPKFSALLKQYREAYERFFCPNCDFPIQIGPRKFLFWTRRTVSKMKLPRTKETQDFEKHYCPACGTNVFDECPSCQKIRHTLLPNCQHCGHETVIEA